MAFASSLERTVLPPLAPDQLERGIGNGSTVEGVCVGCVGYVDEVGWEGYEAERENVPLPGWELEWAREPWKQSPPCILDIYEVGP